MFWLILLIGFGIGFILGLLFTKNFILAVLSGFAGTIFIPIVLLVLSILLSIIIVTIILIILHSIIKFIF